MNPALYQLSYAAAHGIYDYTMIGVKWANGKNQRLEGPGGEVAGIRLAEG